VTRPVRVPDEQLRPYLLEVPHPRYRHPDALPTAPTPLDWATLFGNDHPVEIEVGFGKGRFLIESAQARPMVDFLGIEIERKYAMETAARVASRSLRNVRVTCTEALWFFGAYVPGRSVAAVHVYFPDPWWKRKHAKRRLFTDEFANLLARVVKHDGYVHSWTDVGDYFEVISALMNHHPEFIAMEPRPEPAGADDEDYLTGFHRRGKRMGCTIHRGLWRRR
jgi:tRNA (guanine-N7-)-methyltransferase